MKTAGGVPDELGWDELLAVPFAFVQDQHAPLDHVARTHAAARCGFGTAADIVLPSKAIDPRLLLSLLLIPAASFRFDHGGCPPQSAEIVHQHLVHSLCFVGEFIRQIPAFGDVGA